MDQFKKKVILIIQQTDFPITMRLDTKKNVSWIFDELGVPKPHKKYKGNYEKYKTIF